MANSFFRLLFILCSLRCTFGSTLFSVDEHKSKAVQTARIGKTLDSLKAVKGEFAAFFTAISAFADGEPGFDRIQALLNHVVPRLPFAYVNGVGELSAYLSDLRVLPHPGVAAKAENVQVIEDLAALGELIEAGYRAVMRKPGSDPLIRRLFNSPFVAPLSNRLLEVADLTATSTMLLILDAWARAVSLSAEGKSIVRDATRLIDALVPIKHVKQYRFGDKNSNDLLLNVITEYEKAVSPHRQFFFTRLWFIYTASIGIAFIFTLSLLTWIMVRRPSLQTKAKTS